MQQEFIREFDAGAPATQIWTTIIEVERLVSWISILHSAQEVERLARYTATLEDRLGPFRLRADLEVTVTEAVEARSITVHAEGEDRQVGSRIGVTGTLALQPIESGTHVVVTGNYEVTGKAASLGAGSIRKKANAILDEFCSRASIESGTVSATLQSDSASPHVD